MVLEYDKLLSYQCQVRKLLFHYLLLLIQLEVVSLSLQRFLKIRDSEDLFHLCRVILYASGVVLSSGTVRGSKLSSVLKSLEKFQTGPVPDVNSKLTLLPVIHLLRLLPLVRGE